MVQLYFNPRQYRFDPKQSGTNPLRSKSLIRITILIRPIKILVRNFCFFKKFQPKLLFWNFIGGPEFRPNFDPLYVEIQVRKCFKTVVNFDRAVVGKLTRGSKWKNIVANVFYTYGWYIVEFHSLKNSMPSLNFRSNWSKRFWTSCIPSIMTR